MRQAALSPRLAAISRDAAPRVRPSFGILREFSEAELQIRRELAHARSHAYQAREMIDNGSACDSQERLRMLLTQAIDSIDRISGE